MESALRVFEEIQKLSKPSTQKLTDVNIVQLERDSDVLFVLLPEWAPNLPPYNIARLSSIINQAGYQSSCLDLNIETYQESRKWIDELGYDPFNPNNLNKWAKGEYEKNLSKYVNPLLDIWINNIIEINPKVIGFTLYFCNSGAVEYTVRRLKEKLPNTTFFCGGPDLSQIKDKIKKGEMYCDSKNNPYFDYGILGESEIILLDVLEEIEKGKTHKGMKILTQPIKQRINLDNFPLPNYENFDFSKYKISDGALTELSRGCVAKCTFCSETHFWEYRQRNHTSVLDEIEYLYNRGIRIIWFVDSLVNGNLKELKEFAKGIIERGIKIKWQGYARCDGRMDYEYLKLLKESGCHSLSFGAESASNKVLKDINKRVTNHEMEQNFKDCNKLGIHIFSTWISSFPTERTEDFLDTLVFMNRNKVDSIFTTPGFQLTDDSIVGQNFEKFGLAPFSFNGGWIKDDYSFTKPHILTRAKLLDIFVHELTNIRKCDRNLLNEMYDLKFDNKEVKTIDYFKKDLQIFKLDNNKFKTNLLMEPYYFFYLVWKIKGGFEMNLKFDKDLDYKEYGNTLYTNYWADFYFKINDDGNWYSKINAKYIQPKNSFKMVDYSQRKSPTIERARIHAKPKWGDGSRSDVEIQKLKDKEKILNKTKNFAFNFNWEGKGNWGEIKKTLF
jgi:hypothetical protein